MPNLHLDHLAAYQGSGSGPGATSGFGPASSVSLLGPGQGEPSGAKEGAMKSEAQTGP